MWLWETCEIQTYKYVEISEVIEQSNGRLDILIVNKSYRLLCMCFIRTKGLCTQLIFQFEINFFCSANKCIIQS